MSETTEQNIWYLRVLGEMHSRYGFTADMLERLPIEDARRCGVNMQDEMALTRLHCQAPFGSTHKGLVYKERR